MLVLCGRLLLADALCVRRMIDAYTELSVLKFATQMAVQVFFWLLFRLDSVCTRPENVQAKGNT